MEKTAHDLIIIPKAGIILAGQHLTPHQAQQALTDWRNPQPVDRTNPQQWRIAVAHPNHGNIYTIAGELSVADTTPHLTESVA